jgi:hypothetical protein
MADEEERGDNPQLRPTEFLKTLGVSGLDYAETIRVGIDRHSENAAARALQYDP